MGDNLSLKQMKQKLRDAGVDFLTLGQYLRPTPQHAPVREYVAPERFDAYDRLGREYWSTVLDAPLQPPRGKRRRAPSLQSFSTRLEA